MCGEHPGFIRYAILSHGSSPHVRGTYKAPLFIAFIIRFIPACAGNICNLSSTYSQSSVHPRMCGEHDDNSTWYTHTAGSSPHVRGTSEEGIPVNGLHRFIPACAGNITGPDIVLEPVPVHPRMCGEHHALT